MRKRQAATRARIVDVAARRLAAGVDDVSLDEIAAEADVARATLYNLFGSKDALIEAVLTPLLDEAALRAGPLLALAARDAVAGLVDVYISLYREFPDALRLSYRVQERALGALARKHMAFVRTVVAVLQRAADEGLLHAADGAKAARALSKTAIPVLEVYAGDERAARSTLMGLLCRSPS